MFSNAFSQEYEEAVEELLFAELQTADSRAWWREMAFEKAYQNLLENEYQFLEEEFG
jgi:hypothetical protein